jgi:glutamate formiminotransferase
VSAEGSFAAVGWPRWLRAAEPPGPPCRAGDDLLECVVNVSEGADGARVATFAATCPDLLLDVHRDPDHNRAVLTLAGAPAEVESAVRDLAEAVVSALDLRGHRGAHPRFGVVDVVPFVPLSVPVTAEPDLDRAVAARDRFAAWAGTSLAVPCFLYGPLAGGGSRTLPEVRRGAFRTLAPDAGPTTPHPSAGAMAVGARPVLVAYNVWLAGAGPGVARAVAGEIRSPAVRALGLALGPRVQVSCNLVAPFVVGPAAVHDDIARRAAARGAEVAGAELVGLIPTIVLDAVPRGRRAELGLDGDVTIESRLRAHRRAQS